MTGARASLATLVALACWACGQPHVPRSTGRPGDHRGPKGREPTVRVHLRSVDEHRTSLKVEGKQGLRAHAPEFAFETAGPVELRFGPSQARGRIRLTAGDGPVRTARRLTLSAGGGVVVVDGWAYAGVLHWAQGRLVLHVTLENYVLGVLRGELPLPEVPPEAAGALAIAVRSYTLNYLEKKRPDFDLDDTTLYQRYVGLRYAPDDDDLRTGVQRTSGLYLSYAGRPLKAYYHSTCGGATTDAPTGLSRPGAPPLRSVVCDFCKASKYYRWTVRLTDAEILKAAGRQGPLRAFAVAQRGPGKRALRLRLETGRGTATTVKADAFRLALGPSRLRSTRILEIERVSGGFQLRGAGWGHGVGLCQMGAIGQARLGRTAQEIVAYYYPGAQVRRAY